jgi:DNA repair exonuclease SbcCD ATPase subunit
MYYSQFDLRNKIHNTRYNFIFSQVHLSSTSPSPTLSNHQQQQLSPISHRSSRLSINENLTTANSPNEAVELREHVHRLEQTLHKRDYELKKLQNEIEKGTSSIMSSIEDLYIVSSNVSLSANLPQHQPSIDDLQNEIDQLHDKLDEVKRENQILKNRTQEFDTVYEENEYLYAEKSQWNEELERFRIRQLVLEQENHTLKEREKEFLSTNDMTNNSNISQLKLKLEWFNHTNNQLELEIVHLHEQIDLITKKYEQTKQDLFEKNQHYKQILEAAQNEQKLPQVCGFLKNVFLLLFS